jgi:hypothetical protein
MTESMTESMTRTMTDTDLLTLLRDCYTPGTHRNIGADSLNVIDAHLVRSATLTPDPNAPGVGIPNLPPRYLARITLQLPTSDEAANAQISAQVENRLLGLPSISRVELTLLPPLFSIL